MHPAEVNKMRQPRIGVDNCQKKVNLSGTNLDFNSLAPNQTLVLSTRRYTLKRWERFLSKSLQQMIE
jgi:hypothetical protein